VKENWKMELSIISIKLGEIELTRINGSWNRKAGRKPQGLGFELLKMIEEDDWAD
jgi:hypothetical protein